MKDKPDQLTEPKQADNKAQTKSQIILGRQINRQTNGDGQSGEKEDVSKELRQQPGGSYAQAVKSNRHQAGYWGELLAARVQCCVFDPCVWCETCRFFFLREVG